MVAPEQQELKDGGLSSDPPRERPGGDYNQVAGCRAADWPGKPAPDVTLWQDKPYALQRHLLPVRDRDRPFHS